MSLPALILAAGASRRLGRPKQLEPVDGEALLRRTVRVALEAGCAPVLVVLGAARERIAPCLEDLPVEVLVNEAWETGQASSLRTGLAALPPQAEGVLLLVCDQVALEAAPLRRLMAAWRAAPECPAACLYGSVTGVPALFPAHRFPDLAALEGDAGARALLRAGAVTRVAWPEGARDLDLPGDAGGR